MIHPHAIGADTETFRFDRGLMAPPIVCCQWGKTDGTHAVEVTARVRDALAWMLEAPQLWWHNGAFDGACIVEWYPELAPKLWACLDSGAWLDTMVLQRMIQIAQGQLGGPLALDMVALQYGLPPPDKHILATLDGAEYDVRTSFHLFYGADAIPDPWHSYADYDGIIMLPLAKRQTERWCMPTNPANPYSAPVNLDALAFVTRFYFGLNLGRVWGLRVDSRNTDLLAAAAQSAMARLKEVAIQNGYLKPVKATRLEAARGLVATEKHCPVKLERRPKNAAKVPAWERRQAKHNNCPGCQLQATEAAVAIRKEKDRAKRAERAPVLDTDALVPAAADPTDAAWSLDVATLEEAITVAYGGAPPITEPKKGKDGKKTGGGTIARSRDALQDSGDESLMAFAEYGEWAALINKDLELLKEQIVHTSFNITNNMRPASYAPNILNFRRKGFMIAVCPRPQCGYEMAVDPKTYVKDKTTGQYPILLCPACEVEQVQQ